MHNMTPNHPLQIIAAGDAYATPFQYNRDHGLISGCLYDSHGVVIDQSLRFSGYAGDKLSNDNPRRLTIPDMPDMYTVPGTSVYLGHMMGHYGHFITEGISTLWALTNLKNVRPVFHPFIFGSPVQDFMRPFFRAFDVKPEDITIIREPTRLPQVFIPERTVLLNFQVHSGYRDIIRHVLEVTPLNAHLKPVKLFISHANWHETGRSPTNKEAIESVAAELGYSVVSPIELSMEEQMGLYHAADIIAGFSGSGLHNVVFASPGCRVIELGDLRTQHKPLTMQGLLNQISEVEATFVPFKSASPAAPREYDLAHLRQALKV